MNRILAPLLGIILLIIAYQIWEIQSNNYLELENAANKELIERGEFYLNHLAQEMQKETSTIGFKKYIEQMVRLHPDELVTVELEYEKAIIHLFKNKNLDSKNVLRLRSHEFEYQNTPAYLVIELRPSQIFPAILKQKSIQTLLTALLIVILFAFALFAIVTYRAKALLEKRRIQAEMKQKEMLNQIEITRLSKTESDMRSQMKTKEEQLRHADKMNSLGILASSMAHEINNPNSYISLNAETLEKAWKDILELYALPENEETKIAGIPYRLMKERIPSLTQAIKEGSDRIKNIILDIRQFSGVKKNKSSSLEKVNLKTATQVALRLTSHFIQNHTDNLQVNNETDLFLLGDEQKLTQVFINLFINAAQALTERKQGIKISTFEKEGKVCLEIVDEGCGIAPENIPHLFEPFFTTKQHTGGTGLGLSISFGIIQEMKGNIQVDSTVGQGTKITVELPVYSA